MSLEISRPKYGPYEIVITDYVMSQGRAEAELKKKDGAISIHRMGTNKTRERDLGVIRIPLLKGLLGTRILIVNKHSLEKFKNVKSLTDLAKMTACQASHWPDSDILEANGLKVLRSYKYEHMFKLVDKGRCDYFPRAITEGIPELNARKKEYLNLIMEPHLLLRYDFPMYFFVNPENTLLRNRIKDGLKMMIQQKSLHQFMKEHSTTKHVFPLQQWKKHKILILKNSGLPEKTPLHDKELWLDIGR
jgi:hypothetical protein